MACLPQGALLACKMREPRNEKDLQIARIKSNPDNSFKKQYSNSAMEYSPAKYNSKLMTSIWGLYNRYSPHNIKGNDDATSSYYLQQPIAVAPYAIASSFAVAAHCGKEWTLSSK